MAKTARDILEAIASGERYPRSLASPQVKGGHAAIEQTLDGMMPGSHHPRLIWHLLADPTASGFRSCGLDQPCCLCRSGGRGLDRRRHREELGLKHRAGNETRAIPIPQAAAARIGAGLAGPLSRGRWRICCVVHGPSGFVVTPRMCTYREPTSMTNRQYRRCRVTAQSTWKKSVASIVWLPGCAGT